MTPMGTRLHPANHVCIIGYMTTAVAGATALQDEEDIECPHSGTEVSHSNIGDGSAQYDVWSVVCNECWEVIGDVD